jgi:hypothetical protein
MKFNVPISGAIHDLILMLDRRAHADGRRAEFLAALKIISHRLQTDPHGFGEEVYDLPKLKITIKVAVVRPLAVEFGIYPSGDTVHIRTLRYI